MERAKFKEIKKSGRIILKSQPGDLILVSALVNFGKVLISTISVFIGGFIIYGPAQYGMYSTYLRATDGEKIKPQYCLDGFRDRFGESFLAGLIIKLIMFIPETLLGAVLLSAIALTLSASTVFDFIDLGLSTATLVISAIAIVAIIALDIACLVLRFAFTMAIFILIKDKDVSALDALKRSGAMMKGEKFRLLRFDLSFILWYALIPLTSGMAGFWSVPYYTAAKVVFMSEIYNRKSNERKNSPDNSSDCFNAGIYPNCQRELPHL